MRTVRRTKLLTVLAFLIAAACTAYILGKGAGEEYNAQIGWLALASLCWCGWSMRIYTGFTMSLNFMFECAFYILTMGQSVLYAFGVEISDGLDLYLQNSAEDVNTAYLYSILCLLATHFGMLTFPAKRRVRVSYGTRKLFSGTKPNQIDYTNVMRKVAWILFPVTLIAYSADMVKLFQQYSVGGYTEAYQSISGSTSWGKLFRMIGEYFPTVLFLLLAAYRNNVSTRKIIMSIILLITVLNLMLGNRSEPICYLMAVLWFTRRYAKTPSQMRKSTLSMMAGIVIFMLIIPIIGETRNTGELSMATIADSFSEDGAVLSAIKETFLSMGWSAFPLIKTMQIIPSQVEYHFGQSYFFALLSIFPNLLGGTHISVQYAGLPQWLMNYLNLGFGPGYSMPAEAYYNFGWWGILVMPLLGRLISKLLDERKPNESALRLFVMMASFVILFTIPRREMLTAIRNITYRIGFICLAVVVLAKQKGMYTSKNNANEKHNDR